MILNPINCRTNINILLIAFISLFFTAEKVTAQEEPMLESPNAKIRVLLVSPTAKDSTWSFKVVTINKADTTTLFPKITLGLRRSGEDFYRNLRLIKKSSIHRIREDYSSVHGKRSARSNDGNAIQLDFENKQGHQLLLDLRAYNDGIAFRYNFNDKTAHQYVMNEEFTTFYTSAENRWLQQFTSSYEGFYENQSSKTLQGEWNFPALFQLNNSWALLTEAGLDGSYCAGKLSNTKEQAGYKITFPAASDGNNTGEVLPHITNTWHSPWRVVIIGELNTIISSTLVEDVCPPSTIRNSSWIIPGVSSWVYWAHNHGTKDFQKLKTYTDLSKEMGWKYTLFDWEWDEMSNGGNIEDAARYAVSNGISPWLWYNSGGAHNTVSSTPRDRMLTTERRKKEFMWLNKHGFKGIKIDFFESDKQNMIQYYIDILKDAAKYKMMINFHGATLPRGWERTYPNLMSTEGVFGAEQYNNGPKMTERGAWHNTVLPFTRNVVGAMDYTPVTFTHSQHKHETTYAHELALSVIFESAIQHMADRPEGYLSLPKFAKDFLSKLPTAWDDTRLIEGYPGKHIIIARRKGDKWYIAGINGEKTNKELIVNFSFLKKDKSYNLQLITDAEKDDDLKENKSKVDYKKTIRMNLHAQGGFLGVVNP